jgi:uncharacterized protein (TIGR00251 family)
LPLHSAPDGVILSVRLRPGASANRIDGLEAAPDGGQRLAARVTAVPEKGKANKALIKLLAKASGIPPGRIEVLRGATARDKQLLFRGDAGDLRRHLDKWLASL